MQANPVWSRFFCEYLRKKELLSKTISACLSGAQMASIHEIKNFKKSRDTALLREHKLGHLKVETHLTAETLYGKLLRANIFKNKNI